MLIFIDESGDVGFKLEQGSSEFFVFVLVIFKDTSCAEYVSERIREVKRLFGLSLNYEFKFNKTKKEYKITFLQEVCKGDFEIHVTMIDKRNFDKEVFAGMSSSMIYQKILFTPLLKDPEILQDSTLYLDGLGGRSFKRHFKASVRKVLKQEVNVSVKDFKFVDSKNNSLIQLADMVAGSVRRSYQKKKGDSSVYISIIKDKISSKEEL